jgi:hypothetical protein
MMRLIVMLMVCAGLCLAADVTGKWSGVLSLGSGEMPGYMVLAQKGATVSGTAGGGPDGQHPIEKGTVEEEQVTIEARPGPALLKFVMKQQGDKLSGEVFEDGQRIGTISLDRVKG